MSSPAPLLSLLVVTAALIGLAISIIRRRLRAKRVAAVEHSGPVCGKCGYSVVGLQSLQCPECGSDLRIVGIRTRGRSFGPGRAGVVVGILLMAFCSWALFASVTDELLPRRLKFESRTAFDGPMSAAYLGADVVADAVRWTGRPPQAQARIELRTAPGAAPPAATLAVDPITGSYSYVARNGRAVNAPGGLNADVVLAWMADAGVATSHPQARVEAAMLAIEARNAGMWIRHLGNGDMPDFSSSGTSSATDVAFARRDQNQRTKGGVTDVMATVAIAATILGWLAATAYLIRRAVGVRTSTPSVE